MGVDDAGNGRDALAKLLGDAQIIRPVVADRAYVDLRRQAEIEDLRHDVGRLKVEQSSSGNAAGSAARSLRT